VSGGGGSGIVAAGGAPRQQRQRHRQSHRHPRRATTPSAHRPRPLCSRTLRPRDSTPAASGRFPARRRTAGEP
jgi:hypothetical protein